MVSSYRIHSEFKEIENKDWPRIWVTGGTQVGKSTFINKFLGDSVCQEGNGVVSCTTTTRLIEDMRSKVVIIDT